MNFVLSLYPDYQYTKKTHSRFNIHFIYLHNRETIFTTVYKQVATGVG